MSYINDSWVRIINSTTRKFIKGAEPNVVRNRKLLALLQSNGRIEYNYSGQSIQWQVEYKEHALQGYTDTDTLNFQRQDRYKVANVGYRGYSMTDAMTKVEMLQNRGAEQLINLYAEITSNMMKDAERKLGDEFYIDGSTTANQKRFEGVETFLKAGTGVTGTGAAGSNASPVVLPVGVTYGGLSTAAGNYGGAWENISAATAASRWPNGKGDVTYDFFTPVLVDYTSALAAASGGWSTGSGSGNNIWANRCLEVLRWTTLKARKNNSKEDQLSVYFLEDEMWRAFLEAYAAKERVLVTKGDQPGTLSAAGFAGETAVHDGVEVTFEYGIPAATGYGFNVNQMKLISMQDQLIVPEGPDYDIATKSYRFSLDLLGNMWYRPRAFTKLFNYT